MEAQVRIVHWYETERHRIACGAEQLDEARSRGDMPDVPGARRGSIGVTNGGPGPCELLPLTPAASTRRHRAPDAL